MLVTLKFSLQDHQVCHFGHVAKMYYKGKSTLVSSWGRALKTFQIKNKDHLSMTVWYLAKFVCWPIKQTRDHWLNTAFIRACRIIRPCGVSNSLYKNNPNLKFNIIHKKRRRDESAEWKHIFEPIRKCMSLHICPISEWTRLTVTTVGHENTFFFCWRIKIVYNNFLLKSSASFKGCFDILTVWCRI